MLFPFVWTPVRSVRYIINMEVIERYQSLLLVRGGMWKQFCMIGSTCFNVFFAFSPNCSCNLISFGPLTAGGVLDESIYCSESPLLL